MDHSRAWGLRVAQLASGIQVYQRLSPLLVARYGDKESAHIFKPFARYLTILR
jgi:hypothetical protein